MKLEDLTHSVVQAAIQAMNGADHAGWRALFANDAVLTDSGYRRSLAQWSEHEVFGRGKGRLASIEREEAGGLTIHGRFRSAQWGEFPTTLRFCIEGGKITRLDIGSAASKTNAG